MSVERTGTQVPKLKAAIHAVVKAGPDFLANKISAEDMAHTMVKVVEDYIQSAQDDGSIRPESNEARELQGVLQEIAGCGSGFLAQRCDADCVARTVSYVLDEFSE